MNFFSKSDSACINPLTKQYFNRFQNCVANLTLLLKTAVICPILKTGSPRNHPKSYRPVSLTSHIIKVFERIIRTAIVKHLEDNSLLPEDQHAYIKGRSTLSQLLNHVEEAIRNWEDGKANCGGFPPVCRHLSADVGSAPLCRRGEVTSTCFYRFPTGIERGVSTIMNVNINPTLYFRQLLTN